MPEPPAVEYRFGYGHRVRHVVAVPAGTAGGFHPPICGQKRVLFHPHALVTARAAGSTRDYCKRCVEMLRQIEGLPPLPAAKKEVVTRDVQRQRAYSAEGEIALTARRLKAYVFKTEAHAQEYVDTLTADPWFVARWGRMRVRVKFTHGVGAYSHNGRGMVTMGTASRTTVVALHEVAHQIVSRAYGPRTVQAHGPLFLRVLHALVQHKLGVAAAGSLLAGARKHKAKVGPPALVRPLGERGGTWRDLIHTGRVPA